MLKEVVEYALDAIYPSRKEISDIRPAPSERCEIWLVQKVV